MCATALARRSRTMAGSPCHAPDASCHGLRRSCLGTRARVPRRLGAAPLLLAGPGTGARGATADPRERAPGVPVAGQADHDDGAASTGLSALGMLVAWLDPHLAVVSRETLYPPGETAEQEDAALALADGPEQDRRRRRGAPPADRLPEGPRGRGAARVRVSRDVLPTASSSRATWSTSIDGTPVHSADEASTALDAVPVKEPITFQVLAAGETHDVTLTRERCLPDVDEPRVGINLIDPFPIDVRIASGDVGGPSAGLMWAARPVRPPDAGRHHGGEDDRGDGDDRHAEDGSARSAGSRTRSWRPSGPARRCSWFPRTTWTSSTAWTRETCG